MQNWKLRNPDKMAHQWKENPNERGDKKSQGYERPLILSGWLRMEKNTNDCK